ncbi:MAG: glycosyltransferase family 2 protein [Methanoregulaceae archaeon]|nr:glycosyltransferase family 2 protein [Methanoregulaceae archaeon]
MQQLHPEEPEVQDCTLVIPAYNEEARIGKLLAELPETRCRIIFVFDGADRTAERVRQFSSTHPGLPITCLEFPSRLGKGGAIREGLKESRTAFTGYVDADGSTSLREMERLFRHLGHADGAIGSRWVDGATLHVRQGIVRRAQSRGFNLIVRALFAMPFHDTQCGAKVFRKAAVDAVIDMVNATGFEFDVELLWRMRSEGFRIEEVPLAWHDMQGSRVRTRDVLRMFAGLLRVRAGGLSP